MKTLASERIFEYFLNIKDRNAVDNFNFGSYMNLVRSYRRCLDLVASRSAVCLSRRACVVETL